MAVQLNFLEPFNNKPTSIKRYTFKDIKLDLNTSFSTNPAALRQSNITDIEAINDYTAISKSLANILSTSPEERILNPSFGLDLRSYLFTPASKRIAYLIGLDFLQKLPIFEPRIQVTSVDIEVLEDDNSYVINVGFNIPLLESNTNFTLQGKLNSDGFLIYEQ